MEQFEIINTKLDVIKKVVDKIENAVYGNSSKGLKTELATLKERIKLHFWLSTMIIGAMIGLALRILIL